MPLRFTLRQLEYFVAVGEAGSIALASDRVNVSSPSISAAIAQLEREFGLPLFVRRHAHGLSLTQAGRQFMGQARLVLKEAGALGRLAGELSGRVRGPLTLGCLLTFAQHVVPRLRRGFEDRHTEVRIKQGEHDQAELIRRLRRAEIDLALTYDLDIPSDLTFLPLAELPPYAVLGVAHPLADRAAVSVAELAEYPMVQLDLPLSAEYFLSFFNGTGKSPRIVERTRDMAVMRSLVANGFGFSFANVRPLPDRAPDGGALVYVPLEENLRPMRMGLAMVEGADSVLTVRAFVAHCRAEITDTAIPGLRMEAR